MRPVVPTRPFTVRELVSRAQGGELLAWHALFHRYRDELARECVGRIPRDLRSRFDPDDVIQAAFLSAFEHIRDFRYRGDGSFRAWLRCILENALRDGIKHHCRAKRSPSLESSDAPDERDALPTRHCDGPAEQVGRLEDQLRLRRAVQALPPELREIVELRTEHDLTWNEIALRLGCSSTTVRRRVHAALDRIQQDLHAAACG